MKRHPTFDAVTLEILWGRLLALVDEAAITLRRAAFSVVVREANDFAVVLLDRDGNAIAQSAESVPSFIGTLPRTAREFLKVYPASEWNPGDVVFTNDPWIGTGHLPDFTVLCPVFHKDRLVGFIGSTAHASDIGGPVAGADAKEVFEEGLRIPVLRLFHKGVPNMDVIQTIRANVRVPEQTLGDIYAQVAASKTVTRRLIELLEDAGLDDLDALGEAVISTSERAMRNAIAQVRPGRYSAVATTDGVDGISGPLTLACEIAIDGDAITIDYAGSSPQVQSGINSCLNYTYSYSAYVLKCVLNPEVPNNEGAFRPINVVAPRASVVNSEFPAAGNGRMLTGLYLHAPLLEAISKAIPEQGMADSGSPRPLPAFYGWLPSGRRYATLLLPNGGMGARRHKDGVSCMAFPSNSGMGSIEVLENATSLLVRHREIVCDSGGAGAYRGGCGQDIHFENQSTSAATLALFAERVRTPARGREGGQAGTTAQITRSSGQPVAPKGRTLIAPGETVFVRLPGGGGYGDPKKRDRAKVETDLKLGLISEQAAKDIYGHE